MALLKYALPRGYTAQKIEVVMQTIYSSRSAALIQYSIVCVCFFNAFPLNTSLDIFLLSYGHAMIISFLVLMSYGKRVECTRMRPKTYFGQKLPPENTTIQQHRQQHQRK